MQELGERIRQLRMSRGLSQTALGEGRYSGSYISHIESGRRQPGADVLGFIASRLGMPVSELRPPGFGAADVDVATLLSAARRLLESHRWDEAVRTAQQASRLASTLEEDSRRWEADFLLASALMSSGRYDDAAALAVLLAERPVVAGADDLRAEARTLASRAFRASGRLADAAQQAASAVADGQQGSRALLSAALIAQLGALVSAGRWEDVDQVETRLGKLIDQLDGPDFVKAAWALGNTAFSRGDQVTGLSWHSRAAERCDPRIDPRVWARLHLSTAHFLLLTQGDPADARGHLEASAPIIRLLGNAGDVADLRLEQAKLHGRLGEHDQGVSLLRHLCEESATLGDVRLEAEIREALAEALAGVGDAPGARVQLRAAAVCFERAQAPQRALEMWHRYADCEVSGSSGADSPQP